MAYTGIISNVLRGKAAILAAAALALTLVPQTAAFAAEGGTKSICLRSNQIDHTEVLNKNQILFHMIGKKVWVNNLSSPCATLTREDGFVWKSSTGEYCDNLETIRVIRTGETCMLGAFTPYEKPTVN